MVCARYTHKIRGCDKNSRNYRDEVSLQPGVIIDSFANTLLLSVACDHGMCHVRELRGGMVAPDDDILHLIGSHIATLSNLAYGTSGH